MQSDSQQLQRALAALRRASAFTQKGTVEAVNLPGGVCTVNVGGFTQVMEWQGPPPYVGGAVRVQSSGGRTVCTAVWGSARGVIQEVSSGLLTVLVDDGATVAWPYLGDTGWSPSAGDTVAIDPVSQVVLGQVSTDTATPTPPPPAPTKPPSSTTKAAYFRPTWSGNWRFGAFSGNAAEISDNRAAAYGWGTQIGDTIPDGAAVLEARLDLTPLWDNVPGVAASLGVHGHIGRPGSFSNGDLWESLAIPSGARSVNLSVPIIVALRNGSARGVGFRSGFGHKQYSDATGCGIYMKWRV